MQLPGCSKPKALPDEMGCFGGWVIAQAKKMPGATWELSTPWECQNLSKFIEKSFF